MDIRDKLRQIESLQKRPESTPVFRSSSPVADFEIGCVIDGFTKPTAHGHFFCHQRDYPLEHRHGEIEITALLLKPASLLATVSQDRTFENIDLKKILFLDTETTGISGGTGMFAFLVGLGWFTENGFRVQQLFLDDIKNEQALLHELNRVFEQHEIIVSYNGKSFDAPLLESRYVSHRLTTPLTSRPHLDLLHCVRRFWKQCLPDCALTTIESQILKHWRTGDIPSYLIPHIYFDYLHDRDARPLKPVFYHNREDLLAMAAILIRLLQLVEDPWQSENVFEVLSLGKIYENMLQYERAIELYTKLLQNSLAGSLRREALVRTAFDYKRLGKWSQAAETWETYLGTESFHPLPYIELAKHHEHRDRELAKAKKMVEKALAELNIVEGLGRRTDWIVYREDLEYRWKRLTRKINTTSKSSAVTPFPDWTQVE
ncbi:MAG TPA: ribonuclease H-like domain-containing protein [bacterium]